MESKFYWLKLDKDFFKRHDIKIIEAMPNGKDYILFYLKLLCESIDHNGNLRFNDNIPYNEDMLSVITNTNVDVVRSAVKIFSGLKMIEILDDGTYYMNAVNKMIGSVVNNDNANRQRRFREKQKELMLQDCYESVTKNNESKNIEIDKDIDIDKEIDNKRWKKPSIDEIKEYCKERKNNINAEQFFDFYESKNWFVGKNKMKDWKACVRTWEQRSNNSNNKKIIKTPDWYDDYKKELEGQEQEKKEQKPSEELKNMAKELFGDKEG